MQTGVTAYGEYFSEALYVLVACQIAFERQVLHKAQLTTAAVINKTRRYRTSRETQVVDGITG